MNVYVVNYFFPNMMTMFGLSDRYIAEDDQDAARQCQEQYPTARIQTVHVEDIQLMPKD